MEQDRIIKNIKIFSIVLLGFSIFLLYLLFDNLKGNSQEIIMNYLITIFSLFYFLTGIGLLFDKKFGYYLFKVFMLFLLPNFPIGTYIYFKVKKSLEKNRIKEFYLKEKQE